MSQRSDHLRQGTHLGRAFGGVQDIATVPWPYGNSHELSTSVEPALSGQYHNSVVTDATTPRDAQGEPLYRPVWRYLMGGHNGSGTPGDMNCDGFVDLLDMNPFVLALVDPSAYATAYPGCPIAQADMNGDGRESGGDIGDFVTQLWPE
jgi:hypothetical protein